MDERPKGYETSPNADSFFNVLRSPLPDYRSSILAMMDCRYVVLDFKNAGKSHAFMHLLPGLLSWKPFPTVVGILASVLCRPVAGRLSTVSIAKELNLKASLNPMPHLTHPTWIFVLWRLRLRLLLNVFRGLEVERSRHGTCSPILYLACNLCPRCSQYGTTNVCTNSEKFDRLTNAEELLARHLGGG